MNAREYILASVRTANHAVNRPTQWHDLPRDYCESSVIGRGGILKLFEERLLDYDASITRCSPDDVGLIVSNLITQLKLQNIAVANDFDEASELRPFKLIRDNVLSYSELDRCGCVLTTSTLAIAETGTILLQNAKGQGRRALTLVPDVHICIVNSSSVVATVPEAFRQLAATAHLPTTFVSGPSATADIEMTRVKGVHGPRFLHVVLVLDETIDSSQQG